VVLKLPEFPPVAMAVQLPPLEVEALDDELLLEELLEELLDELVELVEPVVEELELLLEEDEPPLEPLIVPAEAVSVTLSSRAPSSRRSIRRLCAPAPRFAKVAGVMAA
jgi:hypothetical protein